MDSQGRTVTPPRSVVVGTDDVIECNATLTVFGV